VLDLFFTKTRGTSIEVTVIGFQSCVTHLLCGLGFVETTNCVITLTFSIKVDFIRIFVFLI
jgi:hypothetical protein